MNKNGKISIHSLSKLVRMKKPLFIQTSFDRLWMKIFKFWLLRFFQIALGFLKSYRTPFLLKGLRNGSIKHEPGHPSGYKVLSLAVRSCRIYIFSHMNWGCSDIPNVCYTANVYRELQVLYREIRLQWSHIFRDLSCVILLVIVRVILYIITGIVCKT